MTGTDLNFIGHLPSCLPWTARLVLALGAEAKLDVVPGAAEYALPFSTLEDARVSVDLEYKFMHLSLVYKFWFLGCNVLFLISFTSQFSYDAEG